MEDIPAFSKGFVKLSARNEAERLATLEGILGKIAAISLEISGNKRLEGRSRLAGISVSVFEIKGELLKVD